MDNTTKAAERAAPILTDGPLPFTVATLEFIPAERQAQYARTMDGAFRLRYVNEDDATNVAAHLQAIADDAVIVLHPDETPADRSASERRESEFQAAFRAELAKGEAAQLAARRAEDVRHMAAEQAKLDARYEKDTAQYRSDLARLEAGIRGRAPGGMFTIGGTS